MDLRDLQGIFMVKLLQCILPISQILFRLVYIVTSILLISESTRIYQICYILRILSCQQKYNVSPSLSTNSILQWYFPTCSILVCGGLSRSKLYPPSRCISHTSAGCEIPMCLTSKSALSVSLCKF